MNNEYKIVGSMVLDVVDGKYMIVHEDGRLNSTYEVKDKKLHGRWMFSTKRIGMMWISLYQNSIAEGEQLDFDND